MAQNLGQLCISALRAYGGRERLQSITTQVLQSETILQFPSGQSIADSFSSQVAAQIQREHLRIPSLPTKVKTYIDRRDSENIRIRSEMSSEFGETTTLISGERGVQITKWSLPMKSRLTSGEGPPGSEKDRVEDLPPALVQANVRGFVTATPISFLLDFANREPQYKGSVRIPCGALEVELRACHLVQFAGLQNSGWYELALDEEDSLCRRMRTSLGSMSVAEYFYHDFKMTDGIIVPYITKTLIDDRQISLSTLRKVTFNRQFPANLFNQG